MYFMRVVIVYWIDMFIEKVFKDVFSRCWCSPKSIISNATPVVCFHQQNSIAEDLSFKYCG